MTTYHTIDGATFTASSPRDLLMQLRADSFNPGKDFKAYCMATARACKIQTGKTHRNWPGGLVEDMISSGLIQPQPDNVPCA